YADFSLLILSDDLYFFFCTLFLFPGHTNTPSMMTVFYFTVSHRGSISVASPLHFLIIPFMAMHTLQTFH
ncbi:MAG: hypothetical protein SO355_01625, partial [Candidatus Faecousia sp.]|nr:hypothetical protein [Candidatus Faecousia sp.]